MISEKNELSFSRKVKVEMLKNIPKALSERQAIIAGCFCSQSPSKHDPDIHGPADRVRLERHLAEVIRSLLSEEGIKSVIEGGKRRINISQINDTTTNQPTDQAASQLDDYVYLKIAATTKPDFLKLMSGCFLESSCDVLSSDTGFRRAFLRGVFVVCGYCSEPTKTYRIELHIKNSDIVNTIIWMLHAENIQPSLTMRQNATVITIREGNNVSDFFAFTGATGAMLDFENIRAEKEIKSRVNRDINCDLGNSKRQADASARRTELFINLLNSEEGIKLPQELRDAAIVHINNPGLSITELGQLMNPPLKKSGMNHRLIKLEEIAKTLD